MTDTVVIDATDRFPGDPGYRKRRLPVELPASAIDGISKFKRPLTEEDARALFCPEIKLLPVIVIKENENPCQPAESGMTSLQAKAM